MTPRRPLPHRLLTHAPRMRWRVATLFTSAVCALLVLAATPDGAAHRHGLRPAAAHPVSQSRLQPLWLPLLHRLGPGREKAPHPTARNTATWRFLTATNSVHQVAFSHGGVTLWAATEGGLVRWPIAPDGSTPVTSTVVSRERVFSVAADAAGGTWTTADRGVGAGRTLVRRTADGHELAVEVPRAVREHRIARLASDASGHLFLTLFDGAVWRRDAQGTWHRLYEGSSESWVDFPDLVADGRGGVWVAQGSHEYGALHLDAEGHARTVVARRDGRTVWVQDVALDADGLAVLATLRGIARERADGTWYWIDWGERWPNVRSAVVAPDGVIWAHAEELIAIGPDGSLDRLEGIPTCGGEDARLDPRCVLGSGGRLYGGPRLGVWAGGASRWRLLNHTADGRWQPWRTADGDVPNAPSYVGGAKDGGVWVVGDYEVHAFDGHRAWRSVPIVKRTSSLNATVDVGPDGTLWGGQYGHVWRRSPRGELLEHRTVDGKPIGSVLGIAASADGGAWTVGTRLLRFGTRDVEATYDTDAELPAGFLTAIALRANDRPVVGLVPRSLANPGAGEPPMEGGGVAWLDASGAWRHETTADGLPSNRVEAVTVLTDGRLLVGTDAGAAIREAAGGWDAISTTHGLPHPRVWSVAESPSGDLWFGTEAGVARRASDGVWRTWDARMLPAPAGSRHRVGSCGRGVAGHGLRSRGRCSRPRRRRPHRRARPRHARRLAERPAYADAQRGVRRRHRTPGQCLASDRHWAHPARRAGGRIPYVRPPRRDRRPDHPCDSPRSRRRDLVRHPRRAYPPRSRRYAAHVPHRRRPPRSRRALACSASHGSARRARARHDLEQRHHGGGRRRMAPGRQRLERRRHR